MSNFSINREKTIDRFQAALESLEPEAFETRKDLTVVVEALQDFEKEDLEIFTIADKARLVDLLEFNPV